MPLFLRRAETGGLHIAIWKAEEQTDVLASLVTLSEADRLRVSSFQSEHRRREWLTVRILLEEIKKSSPSLFYNPGEAAIRYDEFGKPYLNGSSAHVSITHTQDYVGLMISGKGHAGVDLEVLLPRIEKIAPKFLSQEEQKRIPLNDALRYYYIVWGAKEVIYKIYGKKGLLFNTHLLTESFEPADKGIVYGVLAKPPAMQRYEIRYEFIGNLLLAYSAG